MLDKDTERGYNVTIQNLKGRIKELEQELVTEKVKYEVLEEQSEAYFRCWMNSEKATIENIKYREELKNQGG
jgi:hypothetical protein